MPFRQTHTSYWTPALIAEELKGSMSATVTVFFEGSILPATEWEEWQRIFDGNFPGYAFWFN